MRPTWLAARIEATYRSAKNVCTAFVRASSAAAAAAASAFFAAAASFLFRLVVRFAA